MKWIDEGICLVATPHGENGAIAHYFTKEHGRVAGFVRLNSAMRPLLQQGSLCRVVWQARIENQLGRFEAELIAPSPPEVLQSRLSLYALQCFSAHLMTMPELEACAEIFEASNVFLAYLGGVQSALALPLFEYLFLQNMGYALDLSLCAVTGHTTGLKFISPRTGRAVTEEGAGDYKARLFSIPRLLRFWHDCVAEGLVFSDILESAKQQEAFTQNEIYESLTVSGAFLQRHIYEPMNKPMPNMRFRLQKLMEQMPSRLEA